MVDGLVASRGDNYLKEQPDDPEPFSSPGIGCDACRVMSMVKVIRNQYEPRKS